MAYYLVHVGKETRGKARACFGDKLWAQLSQEGLWASLVQAEEAAIKDKIVPLMKHIQGGVQSGKLPKVMLELINPRLLEPKMIARNIGNLVLGRPCLARLDEEGKLYEGPDGVRYLVFDFGGHYLVSHIYLESDALPKGAEPVKMAAAGGDEEEEGEGLEALMAKVEKMGGGAAAQPTADVYRFEIHMTEDAIGRYNLQKVAKPPGYEQGGLRFLTVMDSKITNFFRDDVFEEDLGDGVTLEVETSYGSTDLRLHRGGADLFILTKITRDDLARGYIFVNLKPANPTETKKPEEACVVYRLSEA